MMSVELSPSAQRVQQALQSIGYSYEVVELPVSARTAIEAAEAIGCHVGQIVKSLVFKAKRSGTPILVIASGENRVKEERIEHLIDEPLGKADAEFVRQQTGFAIGGVPPVGHIGQIRTFIDQDLLQYDVIWAAAGTPNAVFRLHANNLVPMTGGQVIQIT
jgi:prolyl-tRNA editing enzyme YbaK/EbsC (Cys-tRNA(Pro) deacylase)